jgi:hypothetical protein
MDLSLMIAALPLWLSFLLIVALPTFLTVCGPVIVRRLVPLENLVENNEVAGFKFAVLGVVYAVLLGLAVISVWEKFSEAEHASTSEAAAVLSMYRLTAGIDQPAPLRDALTAYANSAIADDWPAMTAGMESPKTLAALAALYAATLAIPGNDERSAAMLTALLDQLDSVTDARRERLRLAEGIVPGVVWLVLFAGAVVTLGFTFFFALPRLPAQLMMTGMLAFVIFLALFVAVSIDHPFTGGVSVSPDAMTHALHDFAAT